MKNLLQKFCCRILYFKEKVKKKQREKEKKEKSFFVSVPMPVRDLKRVKQGGAYSELFDQSIQGFLQKRL